VSIQYIVKRFVSATALIVNGKRSMLFVKATEGVHSRCN
jgi:hypothetical protein